MPKILRTILIVFLTLITMPLSLIVLLAWLISKQDKEDNQNAMMKSLEYRMKHSDNDKSSE